MNALRACALACAAVALVAAAADPGTATITIRGKVLMLRLSGPADGDPVIVSSGDGGWIHLAPHVADVLSGRGYFVVGFDSRAYLSAFTSGAVTLSPGDEPGDFLALCEFAGRRTGRKPILVGVSEGAGLSVLAATDPKTRERVAGVVGLGLPDLNELGWRWRDALIYITKGVPNEPTFSAAALVDRLSPVPLAAIHSTHDEFVPLAEAQKLVARAKEPKRLWIVKASDHRFSDNEKEFDARLVEALDWIRTVRQP